ncbi:MAG: hypothetical protein M9933_10455 [Chitinophagaceae bacterium]|nr:hypothetical protein [Chitinophagaceae bacterium]
MINRLILTALFFLLIQSSFSQKFMHGVGTGVFINFSPFIETDAPTVLTYAPRINFFENDNLSLSAGVPLSAGFGSGGYTDYSSSSDFDVESYFTYVINIPAMVNLNVGAGSSKRTEKRFGFFIGGGLAYQYGRYALNDYDAVTGEHIKVNESSVGPAGNLGLRFAVGKRQKNIEARLSYMRSLKEDHISAMGVVALFNF